MKLWAKVIGIGLLITVVCMTLSFFPTEPVVKNTVPAHEIVIVNPKPSDITPTDNVTTIIHNITIPPNITEPTTVVDIITSPDDIEVNEGTATVTPKPDGGYEVTIPEQIIFREPEYRFKILYDFQSFGAGYEILQYEKFSLDGLVYFDKAGLGISYDAYRGIHVGVEGAVKYNDGSFQTRLYVSIPLAIQ